MQVAAGKLLSSVMETFRASSRALARFSSSSLSFCRRASNFLHSWRSRAGLDIIRDEGESSKGQASNKCTGDDSEKCECVSIKAEKDMTNNVIFPTLSRASEIWT